MILADIQTTLNWALAFLGLFIYLAIYLGFRVLRGAGRTFRDSYEKGGGNRQLVKNVATRGVGMLLKRLIFKR